MAASVVILSALHKYNKNCPFCSVKNVTYFTSEEPSGNRHTEKLLFCTGTHPRRGILTIQRNYVRKIRKETIRALNIKLEKDGPASHCLHTVTNMKFKYGVTIIGYVAIMLPALARRRDTSAPNLR